MMQYTKSLVRKFANSWASINSGDNAIRSLVKAYSYRICGTTTTIVISYLVTGRIAVSLSIGASEIVVKPFVYWFHERIWNKVNWGKLK